MEIVSGFFKSLFLWTALLFVTLAGTRSSAGRYLRGHTVRVLQGLGIDTGGPAPERLRASRASEARASGLSAWGRLGLVGLNGVLAALCGFGVTLLAPLEAGVGARLLFASVVAVGALWHCGASQAVVRLPTPSTGEAP